MALLKYEVEAALRAIEVLDAAQDGGGDLMIHEVKLVDAEGEHVATLRATEEGWELETVPPKRAITAADVVTVRELRERSGK